MIEFATFYDVNGEVEGNAGKFIEAFEDESVEGYRGAVWGGGIYCNFLFPCLLETFGGLT